MKNSGDFNKNGENRQILTKNSNEMFELKRTVQGRGGGGGAGD